MPTVLSFLLLGQGSGYVGLLNPSRVNILPDLVGGHDGLVASLRRWSSGPSICYGKYSTYIHMGTGLFALQSRDCRFRQVLHTSICLSIINQSLPPAKQSRYSVHLPDKAANQSNWAMIPKPEKVVPHQFSQTASGSTVLMILQCPTALLRCHLSSCLV